MSKPQYVRLQQSSKNVGSLIMTIPKEFIKEQRIEKGDYMKVQLDRANKRIIMEKAEIT